MPGLNAKKRVCHSVWTYLSSASRVSEIWRFPLYLLLEDTAIFYLSVVKYCFTFQHLVVIVKYESDKTNILHKKEKYKRMISFFRKNPFIGNAVFSISRTANGSSELMNGAKQKNSFEKNKKSEIIFADKTGFPFFPFGMKSDKFAVKPFRLPRIVLHPLPDL